MSTPGLLSNGLAPWDESLPFNDYPVEVKLVVVAALQCAWKRLAAGAKKSFKSLSKADEDTLTANLKEELNLMLGEDPSPVPGFSDELFELVVRDATVARYDYATLEKKPDLVFRLRGRRPGVRRREYCGLFVECKIVKCGDNTSIKLYCTKGVARFVEGEYSWAMPSGIMVGYARGKGTIEKVLTPALEDAQSGTPDPYRTQALPSRLTEYGTAVFGSSHDRPWKYPTGQGSPGHIQILHLWLRTK